MGAAVRQAAVQGEDEQRFDPLHIEGSVESTGEPTADSLGRVHELP